MEPNPTPPDRPHPTTESSLEAFFTDRVRRAGGLTFKMAPTHKGLPDRLVLLPDGYIALVELKTPTGTVSPAQRVLHSRLARLGSHVVVLRGRGEVVAWLRDSLGTSRRAKKGALA